MQENTQHPASDNQPELEVHAEASASSSASSASSSSSAGESSHIDILPGLQEQIRILEQNAAEHHDAWLRAKAETENMRRRAAEDVIKAQKFAIEKFANALLPVRDGLEQTLSVDTATVENLREGADLTLKNLSKAFEQAGVEEINPLGDKFDPHKHQAISAVPSDQPANTVVQVFQKGYQLEGRVLRPALVAVAQAA